jgi:hypothetical protein
MMKHPKFRSMLAPLLFTGGSLLLFAGGVYYESAPFFYAGIPLVTTGVGWTVNTYFNWLVYGGPETWS